MEEVGRAALPVPGDRLTIGATGFPPAAFDCVATTLLAASGGFVWVPADGRAEASADGGTMIHAEAA